jgi:hypothetical protein
MVLKGGIFKVILFEYNMTEVVKRCPYHMIESLP